MPDYAKTIPGWWQALTIGVPGFPPTLLFFRNTLLSDLLFTALFVATQAIFSRSPSGIAEVPPDIIRDLKRMYVQGGQTTLGPALISERDIGARHVTDWAGLEQRRIKVMERNRGQIAAHGSAAH